MLRLSYLSIFWLISTLLIYFSSSTFIFAQTAELIKGRVFDTNSGEALTGVVVSQAEGDLATVSDEQGYFVIQVAIKDKLRFQRIGYQISILEASNVFMNVALKAAPLELDNIVVSAFRAQKPQDELTFSLSILEKNQLQQDQEVNLTPALNRLPGVQVQQGAYNTNRLVIRGVGARTPFSTSKIRVYLNDLPLTDGEGQTVLDDLDPSLIERVEVMRGTGSSLYGASLGGTILLKTRQPESQTLQVGQRNTFGSFGLWRNLTRFEYAKDNARVSIAYSQLESEGYRDNSQYRRKNLTALAELLGNAGQRLSFFYHYTDLKGYIPSSLSDSIFRVNPQAAAANWAAARGFESYQSHLLGTSFNQQFSENWQWSGSVFVGLRFGDEPRPFDRLREQQVRLGTRQILEYDFKIGKYHSQILIGGEYFQEYYEGERYAPFTIGLGDLESNQHQRRSYSSTFAQVNLQPNFLTIINAGLSLNHQQYFLENLQKLYQQSELKFEPLLAPYLGIHRKLRFTWVYVQASRGFAPPILSETLDAEGQLNQNLRQENGWNFETGARGKVFKQRLHYQFAFYFMPIRDLLVARRTAEDTFLGINAGKTQHLGIELSLNYDFLQNDDYFLRLSTNYTWSHYRFQEFIEGIQDYSGNQLTGVPTYQANLSLQGEHTGFGFNLNTDWVGEMPITDDNRLYSTSYLVLNAQVYWQRKTEHFSWRLFANLNNLTDTKHASMLLINAPSFGGNPPRYYYPGLVRNYLFGVEFNWQITKF